MKKRNKAWHTYTIFASNSNYNRYKTLRNQVTKSIRRDKANHQRKLIQNFKQRPKMFYGYMRTMQTVRNRVPNIHDTNGNFTKTDEKTASVLCDYFGSTFVREPQLNEKIAEDVAQQYTNVIQVYQSRYDKELYICTYVSANMRRVFALINVTY